MTVVFGYAPFELHLGINVIFAWLLGCIRGKCFSSPSLHHHFPLMLLFAPQMAKHFMMIVYVFLR